MSGSLILVPSLGFFSFCWFSLSNFDVIYFLSYVLFCYILIFSLRNVFFPLMRDRKGMNLDWSGVKEGGRGQGAGATIRTDWGRRESIFSKRKKKRQ